MTTDRGPQLRTLCFGDIGGALWGGALDAGIAALGFGAQDATSSASGPAAISWAVQGAEWRLAGDGFELQVTPAGEEPPERPASDSSEPTAAIQQLCRVRGNVGIAGAERPVDTVATRCLVDGIDLGTLDSVRVVSGWFGDDQALTLISLRARQSAGHESDLIAATLFDCDSSVAVRDPRLSTTYTEAGRPARVSLEFWIGQGDGEFPRRAAAEAAGAGAGVKADGLDLTVTPLRSHSRGLDGAGVYLLATF